MDYTYDNSADNIRNPSSPPQRVTWGWGSFDEMGGAVIQLLLEEPNDWAPIQEAQARYEIGVFGESPFLLGSLALALEHQGRIDEALPVFERVVAMGPNALEARIGLAKILRAKGANERARDYLQQALHLDPANQQVRQNFGLMLLEAGEVSRAIDLLESGMVRHEESSTYRLQLGEAYLKAGDPLSARVHFTAAAITEDPFATSETRADSLHQLAIIEIGRRDSVAAKEALHRALSLQPDHVSARLMSAGIALVENDATTARTHLAAIVALPASVRPPPTMMLGLLPFPTGTIVLAEVFLDVGDKAAADAIIANGIATARAQGNQAIAARLETVRAKHADSDPGSR